MIATEQVSAGLAYCATLIMKASLCSGSEIGQSEVRDVYQAICFILRSRATNGPLTINDLYYVIWRCRPAIRR